MKGLFLAQGTDLADLVTATALATMLSSFAWNLQCLERGNSISRLCASYQKPRHKMRSRRKGEREVKGTPEEKAV
jgi:hypothetical protein